MKRLKDDYRSDGNNEREYEVLTNPWEDSRRNGRDNRRMNRAIDALDRQFAPSVNCEEFCKRMETHKKRDTVGRDKGRRVDAEKCGFVELHKD